ncbi:MAG: radical SAM protein [Candidatus Cloacimonadaceae bacterium]|nr:radical SAM protein [Candidatus Cloacimonadaceae bacterium]
MKYKHLFGPVVSRRLGISLGVDLIPYKYCPLNCVYCEVQRTTHLTLQRQEFFPLQEIIDELDDALKTINHLDYITFSGAGEPTLYSRIGDIVSYIKTTYPQYKLALITNSTLLSDMNIRQQVAPCDIVLPSLDAVSQDVFEKINRPCPGLLARELVDGLVLFRQEFIGEMWLEVFIIPHINDHPEELYLLIDAIKSIRPDRVQINSLDRPGTEDWVTAAPQQTLEQIQKLFMKEVFCPVEIIANATYNRAAESLDDEAVELIKSIISRRPSTPEDLSTSLDLHINEVSKILRQLHLEGIIKVHREKRGVFYTWIL